MVNGARFHGSIKDATGLEDDDLVVETCITRTLPPALTLEHGLQSIKQAVEELKFNPPCAASGVLRFQVAVPPSAKALNWFCSQPESSAVFPMFFLSKETISPTCKSLYLNKVRGVFGIGAAISFTNYICIPGGLSSTKRFLSNDSVLMSTYGFLDINFNTDLSSVKHKAGSFYFFIPLIELDEHEDISILAATLAWSDSCLCTFEQAIHSYESALYQATSHFWPTTERCHSEHVRTAIRKLNVVEDNTVQMVDHASEMAYTIQDRANINAVWASLIVEECFRLAPGSRSSPLALAASAHPFVTCISCFDERSLAFHAIGYARGSQKAAVIITTSGTAVSNLFPAGFHYIFRYDILSSVIIIVEVKSLFAPSFIIYLPVMFIYISHSTNLAHLMQIFGIPKVVEASEDFVPLLVLSADRPPELQDCGANQSINQVNHFGSFVRFFFSLPPPTDQIPARMVLTTLDSAVHWATSSPIGPVHINCPFREPLDDCPQNWKSSCLEGLDTWRSNTEPFTKYIIVQHSYLCNTATRGQMEEVLEKIRRVNKGILVVGAISAEDEVWAVLLMAKYLQWPVVADILSGIRLRELLSSSPEVEESILFVDYLDHALLSDSVRDLVQFDVIVQVGHHFFPLSQGLIHYCMQGKMLSFTVDWESDYKQSNLSDAGEMFPMLIYLEPYIAHVISEALSAESALFIGNSMVIRDADMYGCNWTSDNHSVADMMLKTELPCTGILVAGNRGASGIDGLLSTAIGFAVGCNKRVLCVVGDISFLHDTNGLAILKQRMLRKPMTILVINNRGGAIFSLLPVADRTDPRVLNQYFYTSHNISIHGLCEAHGVKHLEVKTKMELHEALISSQKGDTDCVIEVESSIDSNATFHSYIRKFACRAAEHALGVISKLSPPESMSQGCHCKIQSISYSVYRIQLCAPPTSSALYHDRSIFYREGFILSLTLEDGSIGYGEVCSLFPSVRCGLEMAILNAIAMSHGSSLLNILYPLRERTEEKSENLASIRICALIDSSGTPEEVARIAVDLVEEGFTAIKIKVARRADPVEDAAVIQEVRKKVGCHIDLRVDANRNWTYEQAIKFGFLVKDYNLQYIEEPVQHESDIIRYCEESGLPVALDETIDNCPENPLNMLVKYNHHQIVALVIKPTVIGGFEKAAMIAQWAHIQGKMAIISAAFESGLALSAYILFSCYLDLQNADTCKLMNNSPASSVAHGLGTYRWLEEDITTDPLGIGRNPSTGFIEASVADATHLLHKFQMNHNFIHRTFTGEKVLGYHLDLDSNDFSFSVNVQEIGQRNNGSTILFLHGFLGTNEEWVPIMHAISGSARCISVDLPGHGATKIKNCGDDKAALLSLLSIEIIADLLLKLIEHVTPDKVTLVGYSMGARIALYMALKFSDKIEGAVILSGSPGLEDAVARKIRRAKDDSKARSIVTHGLQLFLNTWYSGGLWKSLRRHPYFNHIVVRRSVHDDLQGLARVLSGLSPGRQPSLWEDLKHCKVPLMLVVGENDEKFKRVAQKMWHEIGHDRDDAVSKLHQMVVLPSCGHAVHLENPLPIIRLVRQFLTSLRSVKLQEKGNVRDLLIYNQLTNIPSPESPK
ncbi:hypothetical protein Goarm_013146 [Gossypium armourianum]|uniref:Mandelate racemase/muconate lactonizing enzyme C-terminal domain-containing protein n=1 Tax=Gossypium armourianum TaxID=34283 RepID=A0A7J9J3P1_9ROSI|nr:hypothetical protein [Gossypium armourianum]